MTQLSGVNENKCDFSSVSAVAVPEFYLWVVVLLKVPIICAQKSEPRTCDLCREPGHAFFKDPVLGIMTCRDCREEQAVDVQILARCGIGPCAVRER
jgi:hypothetical protein